MSQKDTPAEGANPKDEAGLSLRAAVLQQIGEGVVIADATGRITFVNEAARRLHGVSELGVPLEQWSQTYHLLTMEGEPYPPEALPLARALLQQETLTNAEWKIRRPDGTLVIAQGTATPLTAEDGRSLGAVLVVRDITPLREALSEREKAVQEQARLLQEVKKAAQRQRSMLREIIASITEERLHLCDSRSELPHRMPALGKPIPLTARTLALLRHQAEAAGRSLGLSEERVYDLVLAVGEAAMNAVVHGGGGTGRVCNDGKVQVWIEDRGTGIADDKIHQATLRPGYTTAGTLGHGFSMMLKTADTTYLLTEPQGTTVVIEQEREPPEPAWLRAFYEGAANTATA